MICIDNLDITGMKQSDFIQLNEIFNHIMEQDIRWDRLDYWDARNKRLKEWLDKTERSLIGVKIKDTQCVNTK